MIEKISVVFGKAVRSHRNRLGISQEELAWRAGLNRTYLSDVERGARNLSLATIEKLAHALQVPLFTILRDMDKARGNAEANDPNEPGRVDILLVEDDPGDVEQALHRLRKVRLLNTIHVAWNGAEALDYLFCTGRHADRKAEDVPGLVLLDLKLPLIDGMEVLLRLKSEARTRAIPVVVLTGSDDSADIEESRRLGADAFMLKPVDFSKLIEITPALNFSWKLQRACTT